MEVMDGEVEEAALRLQYGHGDITHDSICSTMPTSHETSVDLPAHYSGDNIPTQIRKCEDGHSKTMQEDIMRIQKAHCSDDNIPTQIRKCEDGHSKTMQEDIMRIQKAHCSDDNIPTQILKCEDGHSKTMQEDIIRIQKAHCSGDNITTQMIKCEDGHSQAIQEDIMRIQKSHCSDDNIPTQMIQCEDGHSKAIQEDIMCIQRSKIIDVHVNTETQNVTVDGQQQGLHDLECSTACTNTYNMPTWTCSSSEFVEVKQDPDADSGEFERVGETTRQWIVDEDGLLKEVKTERTNWVNETHNCTATSDNDSKVHQRRHTGQRLVCGSMYISENFPPHNPVLHIP